MLLDSSFASFTIACEQAPCEGGKRLGELRVYPAPKRPLAPEPGACSQATFTTLSPSSAVRIPKQDSKSFVCRLWPSEMGLVATYFYTLRNHISIFGRFRLSYKAQKEKKTIVFISQDRFLANIAIVLFLPGAYQRFSSLTVPSAEHAQTNASMLTSILVPSDKRNGGSGDENDLMLNLVPRGRDPFGQRRGSRFPAHDKRDPWGCKKLVPVLSRFCNGLQKGI